MQRRLIGRVLSLVAAGSLVACTGGKDQTNIELIQDMMDQVSLKAQDWDDLRNEAAVRVPPENTVPRGKKPYKYKGDPITAGAQLKNPLASDYSPEVITQGKKYYEIYCGVCHGSGGQGDGPVAPRMALRPPAVVSDKVKDFSDGRIYHIIVDGQGVMGSYAAQIEDEETRWAIVNYVRTLQKKSDGQ